MAINSNYCDDNNQFQASYAMSSTGSGLMPNSLTDNSFISSGSANSNYKRRKSRNKSVLLSNNSVHLRSLTEDKSEKKVLSSFQLAAKLYKSNSDEFKLTKKMGKKSNKKSVLTLPNEPAALPQSCTVSDMNDTEYFKRINKPKAQKTKKRQPLQKKSSQPPNHKYEYYDRDADYCSQMNVYLDCSSVDVVKNFKGDCQRKARGVYNSKTESERASASDVWAVLRNINRFQFHPSPPMSDDSSYEAFPRKKKAVKKKLNRGVYETCRTEQIAYFSNIELNIPRDASLSGSSQITVIDNQDGLNKICKEVKKTSFEQDIPFVTLKNKRQNLPKNNKKSRVNTPTFRTKKNSASKDTLVCQSVEAMKPEETFNKGDGRFEESLRKNVSSTVEVQTDTDIEQKEVDKSQGDLHPHSYNSFITIGTMSDDLPNQNIPRHLDMKVPAQSHLPSRVPWCKTQLRPNIPPGRPLTNASSKVILTPPQGLMFSKLQDSPRAPPRATVDPMHPLTQTAIRRIVAKIKFPLVILGKDQVSGTFEVEQYDYPQFGGLDEHVWPFMVNWMEKPKPLEPKKEAQSKKQTFRDNKRTVLTDVDCTKRCKKEQMGETQSNGECKQNVAKIKPVSRFRDNILKLLYKKASNQNMGNDILPNRLQRNLTVKPVQTKTCNAGSSNCVTVDVAISSDSITISRAVSPVIRVKPRLPTPPPPTSPSKILIPPKKREPQRIWGKAKWASEFIENVINKIKNGTYYSSELHPKHFNTAATLQSRTSDTSDLKHDSREVSIQVTMPTITEDFTPKVTIQKKKELTVLLPGFDDAVPQLEIKSMTRNQIAVKHCVMNVLLQFDVNIPTEADRGGVTFKRSTSCVPLCVTESKTKVFKCKTSILNALLPAELCSIIPKLMQSLDKDAPLALTAQEAKRNASLSTISEYTISEIQEHEKFPFLLQIEMSPELRMLRDGRFSKNSKSWAEKSNSNEKIYIISENEVQYQYRNIEGLLSPQPSIYLQSYLVENPSHALVCNSNEPTLSNLSYPCHNSAPELNVCTDLVPYTGNKVACGGCTVQNVPLIAFKEFFSTMLKGNSNSVSEYFPTIQMQACNNRVYINFSLSDHRGMGASLCIDTAHLKYEPLCKFTTAVSSNTIVNYEHPGKQIEYIKQAEIKVTNRKETRKPVPNVEITKTRKKGHVRYVKLYKKCKSTSHIVAERSNTPLSKVTNLDEFFQALGSGKLLSSVFDGSCGNKIMACISDLKTYTTGITPRQALLVMLLANKKDTPNLVRFRPVILQGIAVNRITRVSELDLEVQVIEKERFNKMPEYLDVPSLIESPPNNDNLLEELIWIAKTTASDYQRRFDESSEKLLKTLLEKRKKLNPSYLRVMARYVGLGLLKTPVNH